jgi:hypothetical protein
MSFVRNALMSPPKEAPSMHPVPRLWLQACWPLLAAAGFCAVALLLAPPVTEAVPEDFLAGSRLVLALAAAVAALFCLGAAVAPVRRALALARHRRRPELLAAVAADLTSPSRGQRRRALQFVADYAGHPFGAVSCWPYSRHTAEQFESLVALYREWWRHHEAAAQGETLSQLILSGSRAVAIAGRGAALQENSGLCEWGPKRELPPLSADRFVESLRGEVEQALRRVAETINQAPTGALVAAGEAEVRYVFADLLWEALARGLRLRLAAAGLLPPPAGPPPPPVVEKPRDARPPLRARAEQALGRAADAIRDAVLDWDPELEERPSAPPPVPLPPLGPKVLVGALRGPVEEALERIAEALNEAPDARALAALEPDLRPLLEELLFEAVARGEELRLDAALAGLPAAPEGGWRKKYRRMKAAEGDWPPGPQ